MAKASAPWDKGGKTPATKNRNTNKSKTGKQVYCVLCRRSYPKHEAQEHEHGMLHHRELQTVMGEQSFHECQACKASSMGLNEYAQHISTPQHQAKLKIMMCKKIKPIPLLKTLGEETMGQIMQRNKTLKKEEKKAWGKEKKKQKQVAGQKCAEMLQETRKRKRKRKLKKSKQVDMSTQQQETYKQGKNTAESTLQNNSRRSACLSGAPAGQTWHCPSVRDQFTQSAQQLEYDDNFSVKIEGSQTAKPCNTKKPERPAWLTVSQNDYYNKQYDAEFTSDHLPHNGAIIFGHGQNESTAPSKPGQAASAHPASAHPASAIGSANAAPIRDVDVSAMLRQIRRALGVREPCRADREARKQNGDAGVRVADPSTAQQAGAETEQPTGGSSKKHDKEASLPTTCAAATSVQSSQVDIPASTPSSGICPTDIVPPGPKHCEKSSVLLSNSGEQESQGPLDSQTPLSQCLSESSEPNVNITRKVRIAHRSANVQGGKEAESTPTMNKLFSLSGAKNKPNWREMYTEMKRKKQETGKGMPRFGIELSNPPSGKESSTQEIDTTLSEGFHWESLAGGPSGAHCTELPPPLQNTTHDDSRTETQSDPQMPEPLEQLDAAQERCSRQTAGTVSVKVEGNLEDVCGDSGANSSATKRKRKTHGGISDKEPSGKKKKTKPNKDQGQMDQLLAVSLREDELSHSLQDLDKTLVQARNTLQAAYTEVQRLLLMRQQFTAEVNSLRTQRIEILQGMQGGYTGAEKATTSSAGALAAVQPRHSPLPFPSAFPTSFSQQPSPTNPTPSISPIVLPIMSVKQEIVQQLAAGQASQLAKTVSSNSDTLQQPVPLFPLLPSPCLAAPTTAVTALKQLKTECATSPNTNDLTESSARQETVTLADSDSEEEVRRNLCIEQVKEKLKAANKSVSTVDPKRGQSTSAAPPDKDGGNVSDASVEMMEPSDLVVIDIDESDNEDASNVPVHQELPQQSVNVEFSASSTQTRQQDDVKRIVQKTLVPAKDASAPECVDVVEDEEPSVGAFVNHTGPVHGLHIHEGRLYTCSGDNTARAYSLKSRECLAVFEGHTNKVNCLLVSSFSSMPARLYTGSSDQTIRCFSIKTTKCLEQISLSDRVLCLRIAWHILYAGLANGSVASYDLKTLKHMDVFECHGPRGVSCLGTAQEGARRVLLVGSYDSSISVRDAKSGLLLRTLEGHTKTVLCMKVVNDLVFSGSSDTSVHAHNIHTGELVRIYKGHAHAVTSIVILGKVMVTACLDKLVRVYELQSHDRLQVYGGHSDMVMCMAVHKSVVYTGCYDGSVQAVKLNLMKNYRCWWQNCSLIFGLVEHLLQHLVRDHSNPNQEAVKCRWRGCKTFFGTQQSVRQKLPEHMQSHVDNDSKVQP